MDEKLFRLGCDIGGTFTDFVLLNDQTGEIEPENATTTLRKTLPMLLKKGYARSSQQRRISLGN